MAIHVTLLLHALPIMLLLMMAFAGFVESFPSKKLENGLLLGYILARKNPQFIPL